MIGSRFLKDNYLSIREQKGTEGVWERSQLRAQRTEKIGIVKKIKRGWNNQAECPCSKWNGSIFKNLDLNFL